MPPLTASLFSYAVEHLLLSALLLVVASAVTYTVAAHARHAWLLGAFALSVFGPLLPLAAGSDGVGILPWNAAVAPVAVTSSPEPSAAFVIDPILGSVALMLWAIVSAVRLRQFGSAWFATRRLVAGSARAHDLEIAHADLLPAGTQVRVTSAHGPAVMGLRHPCIVLPASLAQTLSPDGLRAVLAHEAEHIRRRDPAWHALQCVVLALLWWNPLLAKLAKRVDAARELACDAGAVRRSGDALGYADVLLGVAAAMPFAAPRGAIAGLAMANGPHALEQRIEALLKPSHRSRATRSVVATLLVLAMLCAWTVSSANAPTLPSPKVPPRAAVPVAADEPAADADPQARFEQSLDIAQRDIEKQLDAANADLERQMDAANADFERRLAIANAEYERRREQAQRELDASGAGAQ